MPLPSSRKSAQRVLILLVSSSLALLSAEAVLQAFFPVYLSDQYIRRDDELQFALRENFRALIRKDYTLSVAINSLGLRNEREVGPKLEGTRRLLVVGDSYTFGSGVSNGETYSDYLEKFLNAAPPAAEEIQNAYCTQPKPEKERKEEVPEKEREVEEVSEEVPLLAQELFLRSLQSIRDSLAEYERTNRRRPPAALAISFMGNPVASYEFIRESLNEHVKTTSDDFFVEVKNAFRWKVEGSALPLGERLVECFNRHSDGHWSPAGNAFVAGKLAEGIRPKLPAGAKVEVWNAGVQGWGSLQYAIRLRQLLGAVQPDIVLVMFTTNDLRDNEIFLERPGRISGVALEWGRRYAWQVQAVFADGTVSQWSPEVDFAIGGQETQERPLPAPPKNGGGAPAPIAPIGIASSASPRFSWKPVPGARVYRFKLAEHLPGARRAIPLLMEKTENTFYELPPRWRALGRKALVYSQIVRRLFHTYQLWKLTREQRRVEGG